jgi:hypothetical protein
LQHPVSARIQWLPAEFPMQRNSSLSARWSASLHQLRFYKARAWCDF